MTFVWNKFIALHMWGYYQEFTLFIELAALLISSESVNDFEKHIHYAVTRIKYHTTCYKKISCFLCLLKPVQNYRDNEHVQFLHLHPPVLINMAHLLSLEIYIPKLEENWLLGVTLWKLVKIYHPFGENSGIFYQSERYPIAGDSNV